MSVNFFLRSLVAVLLVTAAASAVGTTWTGTVNSDWNTAGNWNATLPVAGDTATIPAVTTPAVYPVVGALTPATGNILTTEINGGQLTLNARLNNTRVSMSASAANLITINSAGYLYLGGASSGIGSSHYWTAGTVDNLGGYIYVNRNFYVGSGSGNTCTLNIKNGGTLQCYNQCNFTVGNGAGSTGIVNVWGKSSDGTAPSRITNGSTTPRLGNGGTCTITLKGGGQLQFPSGQQATWHNAVTAGKITSASIKERIVETTGNITTQVQTKAYNNSPLSVTPADVDTMTLVANGTVPVSWTAPASAASTDIAYYGTVVERVYNNFATGILPVDVNGMPTDPNSDNLTAYTDIATTAGGVQTLNMTAVPGGVYQWRVDSIDYGNNPADSNYPKTTKGDVWYFRTGNSAPVANAGAAQSIGFATGGSALFASAATISDDGLPQNAAVTGEWTQVNGPVTLPGFPMAVTMANPNIAVSISTPGRYRFQLVPYDTALYGTASLVAVDVTQYSDACAQAKAGTWTALQGDFNADCAVNAKDLAAMVSDWLRCSDLVSGCN
jgi:hypothetical protein